MKKVTFTCDGCGDEIPPHWSKITTTQVMGMESLGDVTLTNHFCKWACAGNFADTRRGREWEPKTKDMTDAS